jgi:hypothetical protein
VQIRAENLAKDQADKARQQEESRQPAKFVMVVRRHDTVWGIFHGMFALGAPWPGAKIHTPEECRGASAMLWIGLRQKIASHPEMVKGSYDDASNFHVSCEAVGNEPECDESCQKNSQIFE